MPPATVDDVQRAKRVLLHGVSGSGTSTAAVAIGARLSLPVHLADEEFGWLPGWVQRPAEGMRTLADVAAAEPAWVFDTSYGSFRDLVEPRAQVAIGLDYPRWISLGPLLQRTFTRVIDRRPICKGNVETFRQMFSWTRSSCGISAALPGSGRPCGPGPPERRGRPTCWFGVRANSTGSSER